MVKLPQMDKEEIENLIEKQMLCRIAFKGVDYPYIAPFQYVVIDNALYFHFTAYGNKMKMLKNDNRVCVEIENLTPDMSEYDFVVIRGMLAEVKNEKERSNAIEKLAKKGKENYSNNFLGAHGLRKEDGWNALSPEKPLVIMKLEKTRKIGIRSP